ncbi:MAG: arylsulfatase [Sphingopyxis macrogoltabida]|uniref:Arylsulfatase n=1 Tax=Sphingopyxis macrogoltabida TaxID=33050 RepID=A0A2W5L2R0_SPHMC|nr:MAG: arylsulfatase [Sphingopyxis macrogoltabida]
MSTPNLDRLALSGVRFNQFYAAPACSPTRAMLLTGVDNHRVGLGSMVERMPREFANCPGYEGRLNVRAATIAERLGEGGYRTILSGKWHLGTDAGDAPVHRGFESSFALLGGAHNHYGLDQTGPWLAQNIASKYRLGADLVQFPEGEYSSDLFTDRLISFLGEDRSRPFFAYLPLTAPHWPLQAPAEAVAKYRGRYDAGPAALAEQRVARMKALGILPANLSYSLAPLQAKWAALSSEERARQTRAMEIYAAMVEEMDRDIGHVLDTLRADGRLDNTVVIFLSDNGAAGEAQNIPPRAKLDAKGAPELPLDLSLANMGNPNSFASYGPLWAQAGSWPFRETKSHTTEGGIRVAAFMAGPGVPQGKWIGAPLHVTDIAPTLLQLAQIPERRKVAGIKRLAIEGRAIQPHWRAGAEPPERALFWELFGDRAVRVGNWKATYLMKSTPGDVAGGQWQLFDLATDPGEQTDVAAAHPKVLNALAGRWDAYAASRGVRIWPVAKPATVDLRREKVDDFRCGGDPRAS